MLSFSFKFQSFSLFRNKFGKLSPDQVMVLRENPKVNLLPNYWKANGSNALCINTQFELQYASIEMFLSICIVWNLLVSLVFCRSGMCIVSWMFFTLLLTSQRFMNRYKVCNACDTIHCFGGCYHNNNLIIFNISVGGISHWWWSWHSCRGVWCSTIVQNVGILQSYWFTATAFIAWWLFHGTESSWKYRT